MDVVRVAQRIADEALFPAALSTDAADVVPRELLDALAAAGLYGLAAPPDTRRITFDRLHVAAGRVTGRHPASDATAPEVLRIHAAWALGVAARCLRMLGPSPLDAELTSVRAELDRLGPGTAAARAAAGELAMRAAAALMTSEGSRSLLVTEQGQRLAREAMFMLVYALRPGSRAALLARLGASGP